MAHPKVTTWSVRLLHCRILALVNALRRTAHFDDSRLSIDNRIFRISLLQLFVIEHLIPLLSYSLSACTICRNSIYNFYISQIPPIATTVNERLVSWCEDREREERLTLHRLVLAHAVSRSCRWRNERRSCARRSHSPSRPNPDSFTPPNGIDACERTPVFAPTCPECRQLDSFDESDENLPFQPRAQRRHERLSRYSQRRSS